MVPSVPILLEQWLPLNNFVRATVLKIRGHFGWNNNPIVLELNYARTEGTSMKNKIDAPTTSSCTIAEEAV